jgi:hypothetical protein
MPLMANAYACLLNADFSEEFTKEGAVLFGNSIGSLTVLAAAAKAGSDLFKYGIFTFMVILLQAWIEWGREELS